MTNRARTYWRSLEELAETPEFTAIVEREAPRFRDIVNALDRRRFLQLMAASMALGGLSGCGPEENVRQLVELTTAVEKESGATARLLWSELGESLAQRLAARLGMTAN